MTIEILERAGDFSALVSARMSDGSFSQITSYHCETEMLGGKAEYCKHCSLHNTEACSYVEPNEYVYSSKDYDYLKDLSNKSDRILTSWMPMVAIYASITAKNQWFVDLAKCSETFYLARSPVIPVNPEISEGIYLLSYKNLYYIFGKYKNSEDEEWKEFCNWISELPYSEIFYTTEIRQKEGL